MEVVVLKGKHLAFWKDHSGYIREFASVYATPNSFKIRKADFPGTDEEWDILSRVLVNQSPPLFVTMGNRLYINPRQEYTEADIEKALDYLIYIPKTKSLEHFVKHRIPAKTRRERRVLKMTPQAVISRGNKKPVGKKQTSKLHNTYNIYNKSNNVSIPSRRKHRGSVGPQRGPTIRVSTKSNKVGKRHKKKHNKTLKRLR
jgi:hypothetical protein